MDSDERGPRFGARRRSGRVTCRGVVYRVCKRFTVESGHMLSKHPGRCRFPHGHTRTIEVVVASDRLDARDMVVDFKALKLAVRDHLMRYDHALAIHRDDPLLPALRGTHPEAVLQFEDRDPTTEAMAEEVFAFVEGVLARGFEGEADGVAYRIPPGATRLERVRVWETPDSWAEVGGA